MQIDSRKKHFKLIFPMNFKSHLYREIQSLEFWLIVT
ncbi:hypothetical protein PRO82_002113 [Candidatus Protochlamydia amoebophila]|nr:hypothetical protein [Candidatus Protochlamydia amoebophila]